MSTSSEVLYAAARSAPFSRSLLRPLPGFAGFGPVSLPMPVLPADQGSPIMRDFREWDALQAEWNAAPDSGADGEAYDNATLTLEERIAAAPITSLHDLAAKVVALSSYGDDGVPASVVAECEAILAGGAS